MMPMTPYLVKQHQQDLLREAEADRLFNAARRGSAHPTTSLFGPLHAAVAAVARMGQQVKPVQTAQSGAPLPTAKSTAS